MAHEPSPSVARLPGGHPIHPILIPFPIAFLTGLLVTDIVYAAGGSDFWARMSAWLVGAGLVTAVAAALPGLVDFLGIAKVRQHRAGILHAVGNGTVVLLAAGNLAGRVADQTGFVVPWGITLSVITAGLLAWTGWLGGELSYRHQIGVIREEEPASSPPGSTAPAERPA